MHEGGSLQRVDRVGPFYYFVSLCNSSSTKAIPIDRGWTKKGSVGSAEKAGLPEHSAASTIASELGPALQKPHSIRSGPDRPCNNSTFQHHCSCHMLTLCYSLGTSTDSVPIAPPAFMRSLESVSRRFGRMPALSTSSRVY